MPLQNRVTPFGDLIKTSARGSFMGNRGVLHDDHGRLTTRRWAHQHWIVCALEFKDSKEHPRPLMAPGCYTELFFLDEATALAAGHRPCCECRRERFQAFKAAWLQGNAKLGFGTSVSVNELDRILHAERVDRERNKVTFTAKLATLPDGAMVAEGGEAWLVWQGSLWLWSPAGYGEQKRLPADTKVEVLTPRSTCHALAAGYLPEVALGK